MLMQNAALLSLSPVPFGLPEGAWMGFMFILLIKSVYKPWQCRVSRAVRRSATGYKKPSGQSFFRLLRG
jgi:hypothetical protein